MNTKVITNVSKFSLLALTRAQNRFENLYSPEMVAIKIKKNKRKLN